MKNSYPPAQQHPHFSQSLNDRCSNLQTNKVSSKNLTSIPTRFGADFAELYLNFYLVWEYLPLLECYVWFSLVDNYGVLLYISFLDLD
jgi:hypothetical protein